MFLVLRSVVCGPWKRPQTIDDCNSSPLHTAKVLPGSEFLLISYFDSAAGTRLVVDDEGVMTKETRMPNDARMPNDDCQKCAGKASRECMHLAIRASDFVIRHRTLERGA